MIKEKIEFFDLESPAIHKFENAINLVGGRYSFFEKITNGGSGISGLTYLGDHNDDKIISSGEPTLKVTFEILKNGIAIYLRNRNANFGFVLSNKIITHFSLHKKSDIITLTEKSFFKLAIKMKLNYLVARNLIIENDKVDFHPLFFTLHLIDGQKLNFEIEKFNPKKVIKFIHKIPNFKKEITIEGYTLVPKIG